MAQALRLIASTGWSSVQELAGVLAEQAGLPERSFAVRRVFKDYLVEAGLVHYQVLPFFRRGLAVVRLSSSGKGLCQAAGWSVVEAEWERLLRLHDAEHAPAHAAMILVFAREARRRGYTVQVMPEVSDLPAETAPDVLVEKDGQRWYVEVERSRTSKPEKWRNQEALQNTVAFCVISMRRRERLAAEIRRMGLSGMGTDLESLIQGSRLWLQRW